MQNRLKKINRGGARCVTESIVKKNHSRGGCQPRSLRSRSSVARGFTATYAVIKIIYGLGDNTDPNFTERLTAKAINTLA